MQLIYSVTPPLGGACSDVLHLCGACLDALGPGAPSFDRFGDAEAVRHAQGARYQLSHGASSLGLSNLSKIPACFLRAASVLEKHNSAPSESMSFVGPGQMRKRGGRKAHLRHILCCECIAGARSDVSVI